MAPTGEETNKRKLPSTTIAAGRGRGGESSSSDKPTTKQKRRFQGGEYAPKNSGLAKKPKKSPVGGEVDHEGDEEKVIMYCASEMQKAAVRSSVA